jgi:two-component system alkaline phosphatase synthesis response regulator PhoP
VQVVGLRKKLGACGHYIETVRGFGYRFKELP